MKRLIVNLFLDSISESELNFISNLKNRSVSVNSELSTATIHDCGHLDNVKCTNLRVL